MNYSKEQLVDYLYRVADEYAIDREIAFRQINQESGFNPNARSPVGAKGIAQFVDSTARRFGLVDPFDPIASLNAYGAYLSFLLEKFGYRYDLALAGYNSGENREEYTNAFYEDRGINWSILPGGVQTETRAYVRAILGESDRPFYSPQDVGQGPDLSIRTFEPQQGSDKSGFLLVAGLIGVGLLVVLLIAGER